MDLQNIPIERNGHQKNFHVNFNSLYQLKLGEKALKVNIV